MNIHPRVAAQLMIALALLQPSLAAAAAPEPALRTLRFSREDEDWRWLAQGSREHDPFDAIKYIALPGNTALGLGADVRIYGEHYTNENYGTGVHTNDYAQTRALLHADLRLNDHWRVFTQLQHEDVPGREGGPRRVIDRNDLDINQGFVEYANDKGWLRLGRQELRLGAGRVIAPRDGFLNTRQPLDGARLQYRLPAGRVELFSVHQVQVKPRLFDDSSGGMPHWWGGQFTPALKGAGAPTLELYFLGYDNPKGTYWDGAARELRRTVGTRLFMQRKGWDHDLEANYQFGTFGTGHINAWSLNSEGGYTFDHRLKPRLGWYLSLNSGDRKAGDGELNTYRPFMGRNPWGQFAPYGFPNADGFQWNLAIQPKPGLKLTARQFLVWRNSAADGLYTGGFLVFRPGNAAQSTHIGTQSELLAEYDYSRHLRVTAAISHAQAGRYIQQGTVGKNIDYGALVVLYRF